MKHDTIFLFYGEGGHKAQMERLLSRFSSLRENVNYIGMAEGKKVLNTIKNYSLVPMRSKYSKMMSCILMPCAFFYNTFKVLFLMIKYRPRGFISTGPGSLLFPALLCKLFHGKIIYIETWSRFETKSLTGKFMYFIANRFYVQHIELLNLYPQAVYAGLL